ncbi:MAG: glycosyltransferase [Ruminiclostridium sp.]
MEHPAEREAMAEKGMKIVREKHTFRKRSEKIAEYIINQNFVC